MIFLSVVSIWYTEGFSKVQEIFSPFNLLNFILTLVSLAPGIGAYMLAEMLTKRARRRALACAETLVQAYGTALRAAAGLSSIVVDERRLPAPKDQIKAALLLALYAETDPRQAGFLKVGYLELAMFQSGVGDVRVSLSPPSLPDPPDPIALA